MPDFLATHSLQRVLVQTCLCAGHDVCLLPLHPLYQTAGRITVGALHSIFDGQFPQHRLLPTAVCLACHGRTWDGLHISARCKHVPPSSSLPVITVYCLESGNTVARIQIAPRCHCQERVSACLPPSHCCTLITVTCCQQVRGGCPSLLCVHNLYAALRSLSTFSVPPIMSCCLVYAKLLEQVLAYAF